MPPKRKTAADTTTKKGTKRQKPATKATPGMKTRRAPAATKASKATTKFTSNACEDWYQAYEDADDPNGNITPEGAQQFFEDIGVSLESIYPILIGWKMNASRMGYFTKQEWMDAMTKLRLNSAEQLKAVLPSWKKDLENDVEFKRFYQYAFGFGKTNGQKSMDVDVALALWTLLLDENSNHTSSFIEFIRTTKPVKVINKDQWSSLLDFTRTVPNDLQGYDSTSSWPVLFDDYVSWRLNTMEH